MAKEIIVLDKLKNGNIKVVFWLSVPLSRQAFYANSNTTSQFDGASVAEITALQDGEVFEIVEVYGQDFEADPAGSKVFLQSEFDSKQAIVTDVNKWKFYGTFYNGTTWTSGGVA